MKKPTKRRMEFYIRKDQLAILQKLAEKTDVSVAAHIRNAIDAYLRKIK